MIPDFQTIMLPLMTILSDGKEHSLQEITAEIIRQFELTEEEQQELLPSGNQSIINNRNSWARTYLKKAGLLSSPKRAIFLITEAGKKLLATKPEKITVALLKANPEFQEWHSSSSVKEKGSGDETDDDIAVEKTPQELLEYAHQKLTKELSIDLLDTVKNCTPLFFENLVIDLVVKMGYGGSRREAGRAIGKSGDGGIDGIIKEDKLGLDAIYIQAKKWENTVPVKEIRDFAGALLGQKARKGIFITTSIFPESAYEYVKNIEHKIVLIDGKRLTELMIEHNVGVSVQSSYELKRIDTDYFEGI